jgi:hypothetical protein
MKALIKLIFSLIVACFALGAYFKYYGDVVLGERMIGLSVLATTFVLMPLFLAHSWKGKRLKDYTLTKENIDKMNKKDPNNRLHQNKKEDENS